MSETTGVNRREFLATVAAAHGAFVLGFWVPSRADAQTTPTPNAAWYQDPATPEINAWIVIAPDDTPELARATISSVIVLGALHASPEVKAALAGRIQ